MLLLLSKRGANRLRDRGLVDVVAVVSHAIADVLTPCELLTQESHSVLAPWSMGIFGCARVCRETESWSRK